MGLVFRQTVIQIAAMATCNTFQDILVAGFGGERRQFRDWWFGEAEDATERNLRSRLVWAWEKRGFPKDSHQLMDKRLRAEKGIVATPDLWRQRPTPSVARKPAQNEAA